MEHTHCRVYLAVVIITHNFVRERADNGDPLELCFVQRQQLVAVLKQDDALLRRFQRDRAMFGAAHHARRDLAEGHCFKRIELAKAKTHTQHARHRII